jgi:hypothetical protein
LIKWNCLIFCLPKLVCQQKFSLTMLSWRPAVKEMPIKDS